jgi:hypothetical protein
MAKMHGADPAVARRRHCPLQLDDPTIECEKCPFRRIIFVEIEHPGKELLAKEGLFSFEVTRVPVGFVDLNIQTGAIVNERKVRKATAWSDVPTPGI